MLTPLNPFSYSKKEKEAELKKFREMIEKEHRTIRINANINCSSVKPQLLFGNHHPDENIFDAMNFMDVVLVSYEFVGQFQNYFIRRWSIKTIC